MCDLFVMFGNDKANVYVEAHGSGAKYVTNLTAPLSVTVTNIEGATIRPP